MTFIFRKLFASSVAAILFAFSIAPSVAEGVTLEELESALSKSFTVERIVTDSGTKYLMVQGKNHTVAAVLINGANQTRAPGIAYFAILDTVATSGFVNTFNREFFYSKLGETKTSKGVISVEIYAEGGVNEETIRLNAAVLMVRISDYQKEMNKSIALAPTPDRAHLNVNFSSAMQRESFSPGERRQFNRRVFGNQGLMQAYRDVVHSLQ